VNTVEHSSVGIAEARALLGEYHLVGRYPRPTIRTSLQTTRGTFTRSILFTPTMKEEGQSVDGFMFVNYDASTKGQGPEAPLRSMKRAHVTRQYYRKVRRQRMEAWSSSSGGNSIEASAGSRAALITAGTIRKEQPATWPAPDFHQSPVYGTDEDFQHRDVMSGPISMLGQGRLDPFKLFPADNVPVLVQRLLDHGECPLIPRSWSTLAVDPRLYFV
jgi:hypothetical protein